MSEPTLIDILAPSAGESVTEATVLDWLKKVGQQVEEGEALLEVSTDKVDMEVPSPASGILAEVLVEAEDTINPGQIVGRIKPGQAAAEEEPAQPKEQPAKSNEQPAQPKNKISPVASRAAQAEQVDLGLVEGSGPGGKIVKADVLSAAAQVPQATSKDLRGAAAQLAQYMQQSLTMPTATSFRTLVVSELVARRGQLKAAAFKVSFTHILAYAMVQAAKEMPQMACHFEIQGTRQLVVDDGQINLGIAVDVQKRDGSSSLMVPVIVGAQKMDFAAFLEAFNQLIEKARSNSLAPDDLSGANMTLTNPGGIGTVFSVPRLMPGQGTIVAAGALGFPAGFEKAAGQIEVEQVMGLTSTYDHRIIQGAESGRFLQMIDQLLCGENDFYQGVFRSLGAEFVELESKPLSPSSPASPELLKAVYKATSLVRSYRTHGHLAAHLDPLGSQPVGDPSLDPSYMALSQELMQQLPAEVLNLAVPGQTVAEALPYLRQVYCGAIGYEFEHIAIHQQRDWMRKMVESGQHRNALPDDSKVRLLKRLIAVDCFGRFMHKAYVGQKQFSLEGLDMTVPMIDQAIEKGYQSGGKEVIIGMAHRGRLNVLAHNLGRPYGTIFAEFEGGKSVEVVQQVTELPDHGTGDVKYHQGYSGSYSLPEGGEIDVHLESNPSHLEFVNPVVLGAARAAQSDHSSNQVTRDRTASVPVVLHGDAAFPGQGVVAETLNLQALAGYQVGGTLHLVQNNQVGFTTDPQDSRSTHWASDMAKGFDVPIIHVNADDPEACIAAINLAMAFRTEFGHDVLVDLVGYRRFGHNESDEPAYTQPGMYEKIKQHQRVVEIYADKLVAEGTVTAQQVEEWTDQTWQEISAEHKQLQELVEEVSPEQLDTTLGIFDQQYPDFGESFALVPDAAALKRLSHQLSEVPEDFEINKKLRGQMDKRLEAVEGNGGIDWAQAEALALGSLLEQGIPVRLTGQDSERGTFSHRHMVLHDSRSGQGYSPIQNLPQAKASMELHNSPLSESACLGFEYGYSMELPGALVMWEGQFGDFSNGAQVIIDQFISSGLSKWGESSRLTLLLPHGYEGAGPEHSSARLERFLQLCAEGNMRVANVTTAAQYYHLLRRQATVSQQRPLVVMTPKSLLRLPAATSSLEDLTEGYFMPVLDDPAAETSLVRRLVLCSGKIYHDMAQTHNAAVALVRIEQLYPFPEEELKEIIASYPALQEVVWVQEEPRNMGAREFMLPRLQQILPEGFELGYIGRPERASPGEGYPAAHRSEQARIVDEALDVKTDVSAFPDKTPGQR